MIRSFKDKGAKDIYNGLNTRYARSTCPKKLWRVVLRKLDMMDEAESLAELRLAPGNHLEILSGNRQGQHSIRINDKYRICFNRDEAGFHNVEITDYH